MGTLFTALGAAAALAGTDIIPVHQGGARAVGLTGAQLLTYVGTTYVPLAGGTMTGALTLASGTLTASAPALSITQTWNNAGVVFEAIDVNVTSLANNFSSILQSWKVNGATQAAIYSYGRVYGSEFLISTAAVLGVHTLTINGSSTECVAYSYSSVGDRGVALRHVAFCNPAGGALWADLISDSANVLALRNGTTQQIFRLYNTYTNESNYERLTLTGVAGTSVNITAESLGTGAANLDVVLTSKGTGSYKFGTVASVSPTGYLISPGALLSTIFSVNYYSSTIRIGGSADLGWSSTASVASVPDVALRRSAAGVLDLDSGTSTQYRDLKLRNLLNTEYHQMTEMTAPSAPAANSVRIYAEDNGAGKTRLMALFATGVAQQLAIEP